MKLLMPGQLVEVVHSEDEALEIPAERRRRQTVAGEDGKPISIPYMLRLPEIRDYVRPGCSVWSVRPMTPTEYAGLETMRNQEIAELGTVRLRTEGEPGAYEGAELLEILRSNWADLGLPLAVAIGRATYDRTFRAGAGA